MLGVDGMHVDIAILLGFEDVKIDGKLVLGNVVISKKFLRTRKIMVMHSNERGECVHVPL